uniref:Uncharacterized protein n=1 Tax=Leptocylindrus danicus TaxID=163516 RepID=A0A7S2KV24_9STRA|mmetsp:Transcript_27499/g.40586  ORF Transcript_27499/g.40586 Transcript_27499/m.40586 type:complete len:221 (+) Transcript_27499:162-824(+)
MTSPFEIIGADANHKSTQPIVEERKASLYRGFFGSLQEEWPMISPSITESSMLVVSQNSLADIIESDSVDAHEQRSESDFDSLPYSDLTNTINFCDEDDCEAIISWLEKNEVTAAHYQTRSYVVNYRFQFRNVDNDGISSAGISSSSIQVDALIDQIFSTFPCVKRWVDRYGYICNSSSEESPKTEPPREVRQNSPFPTTTKLSGRRKKGFENSTGSEGF